MGWHRHEDDFGFGRRARAGAQRFRRQVSARSESAARELLAENRAMMSLQQGETAEDFQLPDSGGKPVRLSNCCAPVRSC
jgi:hypothetical protein